MSEYDQKLSIDSDDELEQLLSHAKPRAVPDDVANAAVRRAVHSEWRRATAQRQRRGHTMKFAIAASILVAVFSVFSIFRPVAVDLVQVASIQKSFGSIHFLGEQSVMTQAGPKAPIHQGQTIVTLEDSGLALAWDSGGSLRIDKNTTVEFQDDGSIFLHSGRVYFDSTPSELIAGVSAAEKASFTIETERGSVTHIGTQFMTEVDANTLTVSVREGRITVDRQFSKEIASRGEQLTIIGRQAPQVLSIKEYGGQWEWIGETSLPINVEDRSIDEYLGWVIRELGYAPIEYKNDAAKLHAKEKDMVGSVMDIAPSAALDLLKEFTRLEHSVEEGTVYVSYHE